MAKIRQQFINNERPNECYQCWTDEEVGTVSLRIHKLENDIFSIDNPVIHDLILLLSNLCNQACITCSPHCSSLWEDEFNTNNIPLQSVGISLEQSSLFRTIKFNENNLTNLHNISKNLKNLHIRGGEPTLHKELHEYIKFLHDSDLAKNITLIMNTNAMSYNSTFIKNCSKFYLPAILLSIDNIGNGYNYMRYPAKWDTVHSNIIKYTELPSPYLIHISPTLSILNILDLENMLDTFYEYGVKVQLNNFVYSPNILSLRNMPPNLKTYVINCIQSINLTKYTKLYANERLCIDMNEIDAIINFINLPPDDDFVYENNVEYTTAVDEFLSPIDNRRNLHFKDCLPVLYNLLHP
jgi:organic radical activating enzyme